jgi:hypothetical protein
MIEVFECSVCCAKGAAVFVSVCFIKRILVANEITEQGIEGVAGFGNFFCCVSWVRLVILVGERADAWSRLSVFREVGGIK